MPTAENAPAIALQDWLADLEPEQADANVATAVSQTLAHKVEPADERATSWDYGAYVDSGENQEINSYAREEVAAGAEALLFRLYHQPDVDEIAKILEGIPLQNVSLHCSLRYPGQDPAELFRDLVRYLRREGHDLASISGSVDFDPLLDWSEPPFPPLIRLLFFVSRWMPDFRVLQVNAAGFNNGISEADTELALAVAKGAAYLQKVKEEGYSVALANHHLKFAFTVGTSFYGDVAKLRAFRALWSKVLEGLEVDNPPLANISAHTDITTMTSAEEENHLNLNLQALAADLGGADLLFLAPAEGQFAPPTEAGRKMARNIRHAFRPQGGLAKKAMVDHVYLDNLTIALVRAAWVRYKTIEDQGGFAEAADF
jgi:methylmalonyl-CoA mutase